MPAQDRNPKSGQPYKRDYGEHDPKAQSNFTDTENRIMKTATEGFQQCCYAQMVVDGEHQIIVATHVGPEATDQGRMVPLLGEVEETFGVAPEVLLADAGYCNEGDLVELEARGIDGHVALGREGKGAGGGQPGHASGDASHGRQACDPGGSGRYAERKWLSEAPNGWIKEVLGFRRFSFRGLAKVRGEWDLPGVEHQADAEAGGLLTGGSGQFPRTNPVSPAICSTPFGITDCFTRAEIDREGQSVDVLNAFRHHRLFHPGLRVYLRSFRQCSTPFGITDCFTRLRGRVIQIFLVLNAFRHHRLFHKPVECMERPIRNVLNAFRHHRLFHHANSPEEAVWLIVLNAFRHHRLFHLARRKIAVAHRPCAQRLSASQIVSHDKASVL